MNFKLLIICGPTGTGKTNLGIYLAKKFKGEIISADSRQVYKGMDIGTGKEWDKEKKVKIWGYDLADPASEFSVSHFVKYANKKIKEIYKRGKLPILVGGTGFYIKAVVDGFETVGIPRNEKLRNMLEGKSAKELFEMLSKIDSFKSASMNHSDSNNKRRLIRAIEVSTWLIDNPNQKDDKFVEKYDSLFIGLKSDPIFLDKNINKKVDERLGAGVVKEIEGLLKKGLSWDSASMTSLGYRQFRDYFEGGAPLESVVSEWKKEEKKYVGRQLVWFNKEPRVKWFDIRSEKLYPDVENLVETWHNNQ